MFGYCMVFKKTPPWDPPSSRTANISPSPSCHPPHKFLQIAGGWAVAGARAPILLQTRPGTVHYNVWGVGVGCWWNSTKKQNCENAK